MGNPLHGVESPKCLIRTYNYTNNLSRIHYMELKDLSPCKYRQSYQRIHYMELKVYFRPTTNTISPAKRIHYMELKVTNLSSLSSSFNKYTRIHYMELKARPAPPHRASQPPPGLLNPLHGVERFSPLFSWFVSPLTSLRNPLHGVESTPFTARRYPSNIRIHYMELKAEEPAQDQDRG